jgi:16S rRNA (guanine966-N2)-methyltransferase
MAPWIPGARVLDLFAGSGGLGLEALSRGARQATFVDLNPASVDAIKRNLNTLGASDRATVLRRDALRYLSRLGGTRFDVAFADPPYGFAGAAQTVERFLAAPFARVFAIEHQADVDLPEGAEGRDTRRYGETAITFYYAL